MLSYIVLLALAVGLAISFSYIGVALIIGHPQFITLILGSGLIGTGLMVLYFLIKFIFKQNKVDRSGLIEITEEDQPELFHFIRRISAETRSPFPKHVYLSDDVNASVFYDSSILSLFLPVKKNLRIGSGLINVINITEFKAVLAHEFGHFSQQSMKLGSYVYYVNNIIYNMLADNEDYSSVLNRWTRIHSFFSMFAWLTIRIVTGIQYLLKQIYSIINKAYSSLSIQMEFHADSVSAFVTGSDHLVTSLKKLEVAQTCYESVLSYCNAALADNLRSDNFYPQQSVVIKQFAKKFNLPFNNGRLEMTRDTTFNFNKSSIEIKDQWASHPSLQEREMRLKKLNITTPVVNDSAWDLFKNAEELQKSITHKSYDAVTFKKPPQVMNVEDFNERFLSSINENNFSEKYKGYYDAREIKRFDLADLTEPNNYSFDELFTNDNCGLPQKINTLKQDVKLLEVISDKKNKITTFDHNGVRYTYRDAPAIKQRLETEIDRCEEALLRLDRQAYAFFYQQARSKGMEAELEGVYMAMFECDESSKRDIEAYDDIMDSMRPVYGNMQFTAIASLMEDIKLKEDKLIPRIEYILTETSGFTLTDIQKQNLEAWLKHTRIYFMKPNYDEQALSIFNTAMRTFAEVVIDKAFKVKKKALETQLSILS